MITTLNSILTKDEEKAGPSENVLEFQVMSKICLNLRYLQTNGYHGYYQVLNTQVLKWKKRISFRVLAPAGDHVCGDISLLRCHPHVTNKQQPPAHPFSKQCCLLSRNHTSVSIQVAPSHCQKESKDDKGIMRCIQVAWRKVPCPQHRMSLAVGQGSLHLHMQNHDLPSWELLPVLCASSTQASSSNPQRGCVIPQGWHYLCLQGPFLQGTGTGNTVQPVNQSMLQDL